MRGNVQQLSSEANALRWVQHSAVASEWLAAAGVGGYPPVFLGRFVDAMRLDEPTATGLH